MVKSIEIPGVGEFPAKQGTPIHIVYDANGLNFEIKVTLNTTTADFDFTVTKSIAAATKGRFTAKGQISRFRNQNQIRFESGQLQEFGHTLKGMQGNANLDLVVTATGYRSRRLQAARSDHEDTVCGGLHPCGARHQRAVCSQWRRARGRERAGGHTIHVQQ
ncbi:MAG: hypothetical protein HC888_09785 [Candidatus Competibacteraceae bacterium]|nr:hypothetical protein [Candidatus Competibacteraceae bacterium]